MLRIRKTSDKYSHLNGKTFSNDSSALSKIERITSKNNDVFVVLKTMSRLRCFQSSDIIDLKFIGYELSISNSSKFRDIARLLNEVNNCGNIKPNEMSVLFDAITSFSTGDYSLSDLRRTCMRIEEEYSKNKFGINTNDHVSLFMLYSNHSIDSLNCRRNKDFIVIS